MMPKATVHENYYSVARKDQVWCPGQIPPVKPETKAQPMRDRPNRDLRRCVFAANRRHDAAACLGRYDVHA